MLDLLKSTPNSASIEYIFHTYAIAGYECFLVGGAVRDLLLGQKPHDYDFATNAPFDFTRRAFAKTIDTGIAHGTISVIVDNHLFEITRYRSDYNHNGRHCDIRFVDRIEDDLSRRDFTLNAMAMNLRGDIVDPFDGLRDLRSGVVRFVGDPYERIREDYLRILRLYRFTGRFGKEVDEDARRAATYRRAGLDSISMERVWSEMRRIISGPQGPSMVNELYEDLWGIKVIGERWPDFLDLHDAYSRTKDPVSLMAVGWKLYAPHLLTQWKASRDEIDQCRYLAGMFKGYKRDADPYREMAVYNISRRWALELAAIMDMEPLHRAVLETWEVPTFPVSGYDLIRAGMKPGPLYKVTLDRLRLKWADSGYTMSREELMKYVAD